MNTDQEGILDKISKFLSKKVIGQISVGMIIVGIVLGTFFVLFVGSFLGWFDGSSSAPKTKTKSKSRTKEEGPPKPGVTLETSKTSQGDTTVSGYTTKEHANCTFSTDFNTSLAVTITLDQFGSFDFYTSMKEVKVSWFHDDNFIAESTVTDPFDSNSPGALTFQALVPTNTALDIVCSGSSKVKIEYRYTGGDMKEWITIDNQPTWSDEVKSQFSDLDVGALDKVVISPGEEIALEASGTSDLKYDIISKSGYSISGIPVTVLNSGSTPTFKFDFNEKAGPGGAELSEIEFEAVTIEGQNMGEFVCLRDVVSGKYLEIRFDSISKTTGDFKLIHLDNQTPTIFAFVKMIPISVPKPEDFYYYMLTRKPNGDTDIGFINTIGEEGNPETVELLELSAHTDATVFSISRVAFDGVSRSEMQKNYGYNRGYGRLGKKLTETSNGGKSLGHSQIYNYEAVWRDDMPSPVISAVLSEALVQLNNLAVSKTEILIGKRHDGRIRLHKNNNTNATSYDTNNQNPYDGECRHLVYRIQKDNLDLIRDSRISNEFYRASENPIGIGIYNYSAGGRVCRTPDGSSGTSNDRTIHYELYDIYECEGRCHDDPDCGGFEFHSGSGRCEIWKQASLNDNTASNNDKKFTCNFKIS